MDLKKAKEFRLTFRDAQGRLRVVHIQAHHLQEGDRDAIRVKVTGDGVPVELSNSVDASLSQRVVQSDTLP